MQQQVRVQEQWWTVQLKDARRRAEAELSELRARLGGDDSVSTSGMATRSGHAGGQPAEGVGVAAAATTAAVAAAADGK